MGAALKLVQEFDTETEFDKNIILTNSGLAEKEKILIVEDDEVLRMMLENYAKKFYNKIYSFASAEAANFFMKNTNLEFDTVLLDYFLPGKNALSMLENIKTKSEGKMYLMSGQLNDIDLTYKTKNFSDFLQKPLSLKVLNDIFK